MKSKWTSRIHRLLPQSYHCKTTSLLDVDRIISDKSMFEVIDEIDNFSELQNTQSGLKYDYDAAGTWLRSTSRLAHLHLKSLGVEPGLQILEAGCGDGMLGVVLQAYGHNYLGVDLQDWRESRARSINFRRMNLNESLDLKSSSFDIVVSYNVFEHVPRPDFTLSELIRVVRPGGKILLDFDPLYCSPWGMHAWRMLRMPYPQFLYSENFIELFLSKVGVNDLGVVSTQLQPLNKWRIDNFRSLFRGSCVKVLSIEERRDESWLPWVERFPQCFRGRGLTLDDLCVSGVKVLLERL